MRWRVAGGGEHQAYCLGGGAGQPGVEQGDDGAAGAGAGTIDGAQRVSAVQEAIRTRLPGIS